MKTQRTTVLDVTPPLRYTVCDLANRGAAVYSGDNEAAARKALAGLRFGFLSIQEPVLHLNGVEGWITLATERKGC